MNDNEIIKALENCMTPNNVCGDCSLRKECDNNPRTLENYALDLINRQKAEIEELQHKISSCNSEIDKLKSKLPQGFEQADPMDFCGVLCDFAEELIEKAKSEARKEFVDRWHTALEEARTKFAYEPIIVRNAIEVVIAVTDNLIKEMECD